jgi:hypothetical protein
MSTPPNLRTPEGRDVSLTTSDNEVSKQMEAALGRLDVGVPIEAQIRVDLLSLSDARLNGEQMLEALITRHGQRGSDAQLGDLLPGLRAAVRGFANAVDDLMRRNSRLIGRWERPKRAGVLQAIRLQCILFFDYTIEILESLLHHVSSDSAASSLPPGLESRKPPAGAPDAKPDNAAARGLLSTAVRALFQASADRGGDRAADIKDIAALLQTVRAQRRHYVFSTDNLALAVLLGLGPMLAVLYTTKGLQALLAYVVLLTASRLPQARQHLRVTVGTFVTGVLLLQVGVCVTLYVLGVLTGLVGTQTWWAVVADSVCTGTLLVIMAIALADVVARKKFFQLRSSPRPAIDFYVNAMVAVGGMVMLVPFGLVLQDRG